MPVLLQANQISKHFGGINALSEVSLSINKGEVYGLIGPNGAGKTTFFNCLTGLYHADGGSFVFNGKPLATHAPHLVAAQGIARTFQNIRLFAQMTVKQNVMVGCHLRSKAGVWAAILRTATKQREEAEIRRRADELLHYVGLADSAEELAGNLPYGDQRSLEIARALASEPLLLCLDEPAAGMNSKETAGLKTLIEGIRQDGTTILLIEHDVRLVMGLCDRVAVLDYGALICEDVPALVQKDARVIEAYLGSGSSTAMPPGGKDA